MIRTAAVTQVAVASCGMSCSPEHPVFQAAAFRRKGLQSIETLYPGRDILLKTLRGESEQ